MANANSKLPTSYQDFLQFVRNNHVKYKLQDYRYYLNKFPFVQFMLNSMPCVVDLIDYSKNQYLFVSESKALISGYPLSAFYEGGLAFGISCLHPDDVELHTKKTFPKALEFIRKLNPQEIDQFIFSFNYRYITADKRTLHVLQQTIYLESDENCNPIIALAISTDISDYKKDNSVILTVSKQNLKKGNRKVVWRYVAEPNNSVLTKRELEILDLIIGGNNYKQIATLLSLSPYTVRAHRRNIAKKTATRNEAELIVWAFKNSSY